MLGVVVALALGVFIWSLMEYVIHRWLGHDVRLRPNPYAAEHVPHHSEGNYFAPRWTKALAAIAMIGLCGGPAIWVAGASTGLAFVGALAGGYLGYEVMHWRQHTQRGFRATSRFVRRHHFYHHFTDPKLNYGVTSPLWDWVFRTLHPPGVIRIPTKLAPYWLADPDTGAVRPEHAAHYELISGHD
ncbi:MAG: sterol desaturase family protein [Deltaproteobacteria bacterium]|nr:sterol desaturase family protein [Deltaproteobacteria bacterium]